MANVATTSKGEIISVTEADQFQPAKSQYECGFFACAMARTMSRPGEPPTQSAATVIANAEQWYAQYDGNNNASNTAGMTNEQEYDLLRQIGLHYQALPLDITLVKQWISWGYPVLLAVTETSVHDLTLDGANPYPWTPSGNHMILATGLGSGNSLLVRDSANVTSLFNNTSLRPGPRLYDASRLQLVSATIAVPPWRPRPASATALPTADMQIPAGWSDDGDKLTAPNGVSVVLGFRHWILSHCWNPADVPLAPETGANPVELGEAQPGTDQSGTRLITMYNELCWTKTRGVWVATVAANAGPCSPNNSQQRPSQPRSRRPASEAGQPSQIGAVQQTFTLKIGTAELPQDNTLVMRVFYATKHQLDSNGTTIPEIHRDIIVLGACASCMEAYQIPTNDTFHFQDGALRDQVDDTAIPKAWLEAAKKKMSQFEARLQEIKRQRDFAASQRTHWGDIPARYPRL